MLLRGGKNPSSIQYLTPVGSLLFFTYDDGVHGTEIWKSDGTPGGTGLVKDVCPGPVSSRPTNLMAVGSTLFFSADDGVHGQELWKSDGTEQGTVMVTDLNPGSGNGIYYGGPGAMAVLGSTLFFPATDGGAKQGLWKSDGTAAGTVFLNSIQPGGGSVGIPFMAAASTVIYFFGYDPATTKTSLWKSDGTVAGTVHILDLSPVGRLMGAGAGAYFSALDAAHGIELWKSDGTPGGTSMVADVNPGSGSSNPRNLVLIGSLLYFAAIDGSGVENLWQTDGTAPGTRAVQPSPAEAVSNWGVQTNGMNAMGTELYFKGVDNLTGAELWKTDATVAGTVRVLSVPSNIDPNGMMPLGATLFFSATDGIHGAELWTSNGNAGGTQMVWDIFPGSGSSYPNQLTAVGATMFFTADDGSGKSLWKYPP
jgi:ELWxxDGT repeat protein